MVTDFDEVEIFFVLVVSVDMIKLLLAHMQDIADFECLLNKRDAKLDMPKQIWLTQPEAQIAYPHSFLCRVDYRSLNIIVFCHFLGKKCVHEGVVGFWIANVNLAFYQDQLQLNNGLFLLV
jgi:hypothetical protein